MLRKLFPILIGLFTLALSAHSQNVINVPSDYSTIQVALTNASTNDTILVQPGTYYENIIWPATNSIKLISAGDSSNTIIDGSEINTVISILSNVVDTTTIIKGFQIINGGNVQDGGGFLLNNSGLKLKNCLISKNSVTHCGGGIHSLNSNLIIEKSCFIENVANVVGGAIFIENGSLVIINSFLTGNTANNSGGLNAANCDSLLISGCAFFKNYATNGSSGGGGIHYCNSVIIHETKVLSNYANNYCGGILIRNSQIEISKSVICDNFAKNEAGGIYISMSGPEVSITKTTIARNSSGLSGSGLYLYTNSTEDDCGEVLTYCNIVNNLVTTLENQENTGAIFSSGLQTIRNNNIVSNGKGLTNLDNTRIPTAENNYWGKSNGPYHPTQNPNGLGDSTNIHVDVDPWLTKPDTTAPPLPVQNVKAESIWPDSVKLAWDTSPIGDLKGYNVYFDTDSNNYFYDSYANQEDVGLDTSYVIKNLEAGKEYYFTVTCYDNSGNESWYSEEIKVTPNPSPLIHALLDTITFDTTFINETLESELIIVNTGTDTLQIDSVRFDNIQFIGSIDSTTIAPADSAIISIVFQPTTFGDINGTLTIYSNAVNTPEKTIKLIGNGDYPEKPEIYSIQDVLDDQGGQVRITFSRSKYDGLDNTYQIADYSVWRLENDDQWDAIGMFNAVQDSVYYYVAPTLCDSTVQGNCLSTFKISAHTNNPDIFYYSDTLSGYSVDNIAPEAPQGLKSAIVSNGVQLDWESNDEEDFQYYKICRSDQPITDLSYSEIVFFTTVDTTYLDTQVEVDNQYYYRLVAYDYAGNRSDLSNEVNLEFTGIENLQGMQKFNMEQNQPNPFANSTTIQYTIPNQSLVNISVYSLLGSKITTLVNEDKVSGSYSFEWSSVDITPGIYFYTFKAQDVVITRKLIILDEL